MGSRAWWAGVRLGGGGRIGLAGLRWGGSTVFGQGVDRPG